VIYTLELPILKFWLGAWVDLGHNLQTRFFLGSGPRGWRVWVYLGEAGSKVLVNKEQVYMEDTK
jgi:hypothetical protein